VVSGSLKVVCIIAALPDVAFIAAFQNGQKAIGWRRFMSAVKDYRDLIVWQKAMDLVETIYRTTATFPREEVYGLTSQIRRAAISIPSSIAEGNGRNTTRDYVHFLGMAYGSVKEVETQVLIAERL
jgi:four helix bundle protein